MVTSLIYRHNRLAVENPPTSTLAALREEPGVMMWIDMVNPAEKHVKRIMQDLLQLHPLVIEDCASDNPFPKLEIYDDYLHLVMHAVDYSRTDKFTTTELDLIIGKNFLLTFHHQPLRPVQAAIDKFVRTPKRLVRGPDRFAHTILDYMVDAYQPALAELRQELEDIEWDALHEGTPEDLFPRVLDLRKELAQLRQIVRPQRQTVSELSRGKTKFIRKVILPYLRDLGEEMQRLESQASGWSDQLILSFRVFLNRSSHEASEGIRVLTSLTALSIPPLLIGGWFGMNFEHMDILDSGWAYPLTLAVTVACTAGMAAFIRRRGWL
ncbi:magnesium transporter CorA family protein [Actomonas aquatica]|uniref:Magnesium transporter CorA family protein n=1 Tax=Actomonas aquatica TaxID=2866162 RepID=A0ABZ1C536_9BACT|nr:magnesium transporter CorA family protein [Opitutus sp. WL0086]WRQ86770.1 magnesium transporter CorA family protein [Opitutus sp. WL0086]